MKISIQTGKGRINSNYNTAIVRFEDSDHHFFRDQMNWMPKHSEIEIILQTLIMMEGTSKREILCKMFKDAIDRGMACDLEYNK
tara:strand:+ start:1248 stop:1499 length:252 start_codon:yes stop_codon:yes gene_type:complete